MAIAEKKTRTAYRWKALHVLHKEESGKERSEIHLVRTHRQRKMISVGTEEEKDKRFRGGIPRKNVHDSISRGITGGSRRKK